MSLSTITPPTSTPTPASAPDAAVASPKPTTPAKRRGSNRTAPQPRFQGRNSRGLKRFLAAAETLHGRKLSATERGACISLCSPLSRDNGGGGGGR